MGDCHLAAAYLNLFSNGRGNWHADITSESDDDSWVVSKITISDINGNQIFVIPKFSMTSTGALTICLWTRV